MKITSINKEFDAVKITQEEVTIQFYEENSKKLLPFTSHFYITSLPTEIDIILGLPFIKTLNPHIYELQFGSYKLRPMTIKETPNIRQVLAITEKVFKFGKDDPAVESRLQLLSDTVPSKKLTELLANHQAVFTESFTSLLPHRNIEFF